MKNPLASVAFVCALALVTCFCSRASGRETNASQSRVPIDLQASVSAVLGRDNPDYEVRSVDGRLDAANPRQKLSVHFTSKRIEVSDRRSGWALALRAYGYASAVNLSPATAARASFNRVELERGPITEWYVNGPIGLEQGFTISEPPSQIRRGPLTIVMELSGDMKVTADEDGTGLTLIGPGGDRWRYTGLTAGDAEGRNLRAWLELTGQDLLLKVDDIGARYPLILDPWIQHAELTTSDGQAGDFFGSATAISGNTVVVGAPNATIGSNAAQGAAYIFVKPAAGWGNTSSPTAKLTASDGLANDNFGSAVSISGNSVVIGACSQSGVCNNGPGKAYVYVEPAGGWVTSSAFNAELTASDGVDTDAFSNSVTIANGTVLVGAPGATVGQNANQGAAYVFVKPKAGWVTMTETAKLTAKDGQSGDYAGFTSLDGTASVALFGASGGSSTAQTPGAAYIFLKPKHGWKTTSTFKAKLSASDGKAGDEFGFCNFGGGCLSADGKTVIVGAPQGTNGPGKAYVFLEPKGGWVTTSKFHAELKAKGGQTGDNFGFAAAINGAGNAVVIGATGVNTSQGAVYVFLRPSAGWKSTSKFYSELTAADGRPYSFLSYGGAGISGSTVAVGAAGTKVGNNKDQGAAYIFGP